MVNFDFDRVRIIAILRIFVAKILLLFRQQFCTSPVWELLYTNKGFQDLEMSAPLMGSAIYLRMSFQLLVKSTSYFRLKYSLKV